MFCNAGKVLREPVIKWEEVRTEVKNTVKYLGLTIDRSFLWIEHCKELRKKTTNIWHRAMAISRRLWGTAPPILRRVYLQGIRPIFTYGSEIWGSRGGDIRIKRHLSAIQRPYLLAITKCYRTTATASMEILTGIESLWLKIKDRNHYYNMTMESAYEAELPVKEKDHPANKGKIKFTLMSTGTLGENDHLSIYTDGSKINERVGAGVVVYQMGNELETYKQGSMMPVLFSKLNCMPSR